MLIDLASIILYAMLALMKASGVRGRASGALGFRAI